MRRRTAIGLAALLTAGLGAGGVVLGLNLAGDAATTGSSVTGHEEPLSFGGDWEVPEPILGQWSGAQCENTSAVRDDATWNRGRLYVVSDVVASGAKAARFDLPADGQRRQACEALHERFAGTGQGHPSYVEWYALALRLPSNYTASSWGLTLAQFNYQNLEGSGGPPLQLVGVSSAHTWAGGGNAVALIVSAGPCKLTAPNQGCAYANGAAVRGGMPQMFAIPANRFALDVWHELLIGVRWTTALHGSYEVYHRRQGETAWAQTVNESGSFPTVHWAEGGTLSPTKKTLDKIGGYRGPNTTALSIWHDNFCRGSTREIVEACL